MEVMNCSSGLITTTGTGSLELEGSDELDVVSELVLTVVLSGALELTVLFELKELSSSLVALSELSSSLLVLAALPLLLSSSVELSHSLLDVTAEELSVLVSLVSFLLELLSVSFVVFVVSLVSAVVLPKDDELI